MAQQLAYRRFTTEGVYHVGPVAILHALEIEAARWPDVATTEARKANRARKTAEIIALREPGWKVAAIAALFNTTDAAMSQRIRRALQHRAQDLTDCRRNVEVVQHGEGV